MGLRSIMKSYFNCFILQCSSTRNALFCSAAVGVKELIIDSWQYVIKQSVVCGHQEFRRDIHAEATEEVMRYCKVSSVPLPIKIFNYLQFKVLQIYYMD